LSGNFVRLDQGFTVGQTPAKPGSSGRFAVLPKSNNTLNVSRDFLGFLVKFILFSRNEIKIFML
jgi:hypothetical protein